MPVVVPRKTQKSAQSRRALWLMLGAMQSPSITALIAASAARYGLDPSLVLAVAQRESGLNPNAIGRDGEQGVMQLMPSTAESLGVTDPFNPVQNVDAGARYLSQLVAQFGGDVVKAVAAYDWGPGNVSKAIAQYGDGWLGAAPSITKSYLADVLGVIAPETINPPLTIDAQTGEVIPTPSGTYSVQEAGILPAGLSMGQILLLATLGFGLYFVSQRLSE